MTADELFLQEQEKVKNHSFIQELQNSESQITAKRYATYLYNQHLQVNLLEQLALAYGATFMRTAPAMWNDYKELWATTDDPSVSPSTLEVVDEHNSYIMKLRDDAKSLRSHTYVRHMLDLNLSNTYSVPGPATLYTYEQPIDKVKEQLTMDELYDKKLYQPEMQLAFDFVIKQLDQMEELL